MRYYKNLYLQEGLEKKKAKIMKKLNDNKLQVSMHLIVLAENGKNQLEILNSLFLLQKDYPAADVLVVGLAKSYEDALEIVEKITQEVYDNTKGADIRSYLLRKEQED